MKFDESGIRAALILFRGKVSASRRPASHRILYYTSRQAGVPLSNSSQRRRHISYQSTVREEEEVRHRRACMFFFFCYVCFASFQFDLHAEDGLRRRALIELALKITHIFFRLRVPASVSAIYPHLN